MTANRSMSVLAISHGDDQELSYEECKRAREWIRTAGVENVDSLFAAHPGDGEESLPRARARGSWQA